MITMPQANIEQLLHFLSICILSFINQGTSSLSTAFLEDPYSWGLTIPISLYFKFALELHAHLGIFVGIGLPSAIYWSFKREPIDWYWETILDFNIEFLKTGCFNFIIGVAHWLVLKLLHHFHEWARQNKRLSSWPVLTRLEATKLLEHPLLRPIPASDLFLKIFELLSVFFYNGNIMLLGWGLSGMEYSPDVGKAISWVSLGSAMFVWMKACLKLLAPPPAPEEKPYKGANDQTIDQSVGAGGEDKAICLSLAKC